MPEGHIIHRVKRDHQKHYAGNALSVSSPQGRFLAGAKRLDGKVLEQIEANGKHLFYFWEGGQILHIHLGLYGKFHNHGSLPPEPRGAVRLRVIGKSHAFDLNGPTACELIDIEKHQAISARLGADPLRRNADIDGTWQRIRGSRSAIGKLLLDQSVIAGIGNVYRAEALFATRLNPKRRGDSLTREEFTMLWRTLVEMMRAGVKDNRIITVTPRPRGKSFSRLSAAERLMCYKKERCPTCQGPIENWELAARTMYACLNCQC